MEFQHVAATVSQQLLKKPLDDLLLASEMTKEGWRLALHHGLLHWLLNIRAHYTQRGFAAANFAVAWTKSLLLLQPLHKQDFLN